MVAKWIKHLYLCSYSFTTADRELETLYLPNWQLRSGFNWVTALWQKHNAPRKGTAMPQWQGHSDVSIYHETFCYSHQPNAKVRQAKSDKTSQGRYWCLLWFTFCPTNLESSLVLLLPHGDASKICGFLSSTQGRPMVGKYIKVLVIFLSFFYLDFKALLPNNPTGNGTVDTLRAKVQLQFLARKPKQHAVIWNATQKPGSASNPFTSIRDP